MYSGYPTFVFAIAGIAGLTAFIGDAASHFGCTIGLRDTITAISFVALGTSVPGGCPARARESGAAGTAMLYIQPCRRRRYTQSVQ